MLDKELYKDQLDSLVEFGNKNGYTPLKMIYEVFPGCDDDMLDDIEDHLRSLSIDVTREDESMDADSIAIDEIDLDLEDVVEEEPDDADLLLEEEAEIKVSDFDNIEQTPYQSDDIVKMYLHEIGQVELLSITQESELARRVQDGLIYKEKKEQYEKSGKKISDEDLEEIESYIEDGQEAQSILIESNLRLVVSIAKRYIGRGLQLSDLIQEGNLGLMKAVLKFDPTRGFKFSTYATWWIRQSITRAIADKGRNVRIPVHMHESINRLSRTQRRLVQELHREPTTEEIANEMKLSVEKVVELQRVAQDSISFDNSVGDEEDSTLIDLVPDENTLNPLEYTEKKLYSEEMNEVLQTLTPREEMVIRLRYGIGVDCRSHTLEEVGKIMGVTRERVRQIESKAINRLRHHQRMNRLRKHQ